MIIQEFIRGQESNNVTMSTGQSRNSFYEDESPRLFEH